MLDPLAIAPGDPRELEVHGALDDLATPKETVIQTRFLRRNQLDLNLALTWDERGVSGENSTAGVSAVLWLLHAMDEYAEQGPTRSNKPPPPRVELLS